MNKLYTQEKIIDGKIVRRSTNWPNYGATACGTIYRWDREYKMASTLTQHGYLSVRFSHNNIPESRFVHVVVAQCWVDNPDNKSFVNHIDGNKANPVASNLEWVSSSENQRHALSLRLKQQGSDLYNSSLTIEQVHEACKLLQEGWRVPDIAKRLNASRDVLSKIKSGDCYPEVRAQYSIDVKYKDNFSESTVRWVCERIVEGLADATIADLSTNKKLSVYQVKRIRNKIRYSTISSEYF